MSLTQRLDLGALRAELAATEAAAPAAPEPTPPTRAAILDQFGLLYAVDVVDPDQLDTLPVGSIVASDPAGDPTAPILVSTRVSPTGHYQWATTGQHRVGSAAGVLALAPRWRVVELPREGRLR